MGKIISLVSPKGGATKSTLALCLADYFYKWDQEIAIVDLDPQGSLRSWSQERSVNENLSDEEKRAIPVEFYGEDAFTFEDLTRLEEHQENIIIDCPGESEAGPKTRTALAFSDLVIIPVRNADFDVKSLFEHLLPTLEEAQKSNIRNGKVMFLPTLCHYRADLKKTIKDYTGLGYPVINALFYQRKIFGTFPDGGLSLSDCADHGKTGLQRAQAITALKDVEKIAMEILNSSEV